MDERIKRLEAADEPDRDKEIAALRVLGDLAERNKAEGSAKYDELVTLLHDIGVGSQEPERAVVFAERVSTLKWLQREARRRASG